MLTDKSIQKYLSVNNVLLCLVPVPVVIPYYRYSCNTTVVKY